MAETFPCRLSCSQPPSPTASGAKERACPALCPFGGLLRSRDPSLHPGPSGQRCGSEAPRDAAGEAGGDLWERGRSGCRSRSLARAHLARLVAYESAHSWHPTNAPLPGHSLEGGPRNLQLDMLLGCIFLTETRERTGLWCLAEPSWLIWESHLTSPTPSASSIKWGLGYARDGKYEDRHTYTERRGRGCGCPDHMPWGPILLGPSGPVCDCPRARE